MKKFISVILMLVVAAVMFNGSAWAEEDDGFNKVLTTAHNSNFTQCDVLIKAAYYDFGLHELGWSFNATSKNRVFSIQFIRHYTDMSNLLSFSFVALPDGCNNLVEQTFFTSEPCDQKLSTQLKGGYTVEGEDKKRGIVTISKGNIVQFLIPREKGCHVASRALYTYTFESANKLLADVMEGMAKTAKPADNKPTEPVKPVETKAKEEPKPQPQPEKPQFRE